MDECNKKEILTRYLNLAQSLTFSACKPFSSSRGWMVHIIYKGSCDTFDIVYIFDIGTAQSSRQQDFFSQSQLVS
jgi:hypothetical protein